jgi:hypothetical protein
MSRVTLINITLIIAALLLFPGCQKTPSNSGNNGEPGDNNDNGGSGNTYYVSTTGSDQNSGSRDQPWATPGYASRQLSPGDTLIISGGRYILKEYDADILMPPDGTADNRVTIKGEKNNRPVLAGRANLSHALSLSSYLTVENIEFTADNGAWFREAISQVDRPIAGVELKDLFIHHLDEFGIDIGDINHLTVSDCVITYTGFGSIGGPTAQDGGWQNVVIDGCELSYNGHYYQGGPGPGPYDRPDGFGIEPSNGPIEIKDTTAQHNRGDGLDSKAANTYIHHCIIANNRCDGIKLWAGGSKIENCLIYGTGDGEGGASPWAGLVIEGSSDGDTFDIVNVTIHDNPSRRAYPMYIGYDQLADITVTMKNCIVANGYGAAYFGPRVTVTITYNLFHRPGDTIQVEANAREYSTADIRNGLLGPGNQVGNPQFIQPAWSFDGNYRLQNTSPAIDAATPNGAPSDDLDHNPRPIGPAPDTGAYEKQ